MFIHYLALITALALSCVSGYFSIIGLTAIFAGAFWQILAMGSLLELSKLVSVSWLYRSWNHSPKLIKYYLSVVVAVLMILNAIGTFGFLSRAHIEQFSSIQGQNVVEIDTLDQQINLKKNQVDDYTKQIQLIDDSTQKLVETKKVNQALNVETKRHNQRLDLTNKKQILLTEISQLEEKRLKISQVQKQAETEIGPIKYVAMLIYNDSSENQVERAVRMMILLLVAVCDPTAIVLLMASNHGLKRKYENQKNILPQVINSDNVKTQTIVFEKNPFNKE